MNDLIVVPKENQWLRLKSLVLDSVSSPITKRVYNLGLDEFFAWWVALETRGLGAVCINMRITEVRKPAVKGADNGLCSELATGITRVRGIAIQVSVQRAQVLLDAPDIATRNGAEVLSSANSRSSLNI